MSTRSLRYRAQEVYFEEHEKLLKRPLRSEDLDQSDPDVTLFCCHKLHIQNVCMHFPQYGNIKVFITMYMQTGKTIITFGAGVS